MNAILEITEQRRQELVSLSLDEAYTIGNTPPLYASKKKPPKTLKKRGRPREYLMQRICPCGNLARIKLSFKRIKYWNKRCADCHSKKYYKPRKPRTLAQQNKDNYIPSWKTLKQK